MKDDEIGESAEKEALAQLEIIRALKPLSGESRLKLLKALHHLMEADALVPGIMKMLRSK